MDSISHRIKDFLRVGHLGTLLTSFFFFDMCFAIWVLNGAMAPAISEEFRLSPSEKGLMVSVPVFVGSLLRLPLGILSQYIGRKRAAQVEMGLIALGLLMGFLQVKSLTGVIFMGIILGVAGASFGVALSLGSGWYPPRHKGLAMGIAGAGNSGAALALLFAPGLANTYGWRAVYGIAIGPIVLAMVLLQIFAKEPPDREDKRLGDYVKLLVDRDAWIFNLLYMVTFGGYIGLTSFLPTLFHDQYGIPKENIGRYSVGIVFAASALRVIGGWLSDRVGGIRLLLGLSVVIIGSIVAASLIPSNPWVMVAILIVCFSAMGAGNGAVFQLVPLRFRTTTAVAGSLIGEIGALAGSALPYLMGLGKEKEGSFAPGFLSGAALAVVALGTLLAFRRQWTATWVGEGGKAREGEPRGDVVSES